MYYASKKNAFTVLEVIFVIVILGVVASISSELIVRVYEQYIIQRAEYRASLKTGLASIQIANRLANAIPGTIYRIKNNNHYEPIESNLTASGELYKGIQWVAADMDSFNTSIIPGWSGFCDLNASKTPTISTPGSNLSKTNTIISKLAGGTLPLFNPVLYFPHDPKPYPITTPLSGSTITFTGTIPTHIAEHYKLAWSSYALVVEPEIINGKTYNSLFLYYHFVPTPAVLYTAGRKALLMRNISTFKFKSSGQTIRFKICKEEKVSENINENITACKEKAVF